MTAGLGSYPIESSRLYNTSYAPGDKIVWFCYGRCTRTEYDDHGKPIEIRHPVSETRHMTILDLGPAVERGAVAPCRIGVIEEGGRLLPGCRVGKVKCHGCHRMGPALFPPDADYVAEHAKAKPAIEEVSA